MAACHGTAVVDSQWAVGNISDRRTTKESRVGGNECVVPGAVPGKASGGVGDVGEQVLSPDKKTA
jgi:hypothetical protein